MLVLDSVDSCPWPDDRAVVTIGVYDGVHRGHQEVIRRVVDTARQRGVRSAVVTFDRHPATVVRPESAPAVITGRRHRLELLEATGVDATLVLPFDAAASTEDARSFARRVFVDGLQAICVIVGSDFHFGRGREGDVTLLSEVGQESGFEVEPVDLVPRHAGGAVISSTAIRAALADGNIARAAEMLGRPAELRGRVIDGDRRGRTIGVPTANVDTGPGMAMPSDGVYAAEFVRADGSVHPAVVNIGRRPTFYAAAERSLVEAHLLGFDGDLYGEEVAVRFVERLRDEQRFDGLDSLVAQLRRDISRAAEVLGVVGFDAES